MCCLLEKFIYIVFVCNSNWILNVLVRRFDGDVRKKKIIECYVNLREFLVIYLFFGD